MLRRYVRKTSQVTLIAPWPSLARRSFSSEDVQNVAVLGGGITGLASAYYITQQLPKVKVTVYEASDRIGGWLSSKRVPVADGSIIFEAGPRTLRPSSNGALATRLIQELDLANDTIFASKFSTSARNRYVYYPDHLVRMPAPGDRPTAMLYSLWSEPIFEGTPWAILKEFFTAPRGPTMEDESVGDFFGRRLCSNSVDRVLSAVLHGIYAGDAYRLSAKSLFPGPWRDEAAAGGIIAGLMMTRVEGAEMTKREVEYLQEMKDYAWHPRLRQAMMRTSVFTFKDGISMLVDRLTRRLVEHGNVEFKTSTPVAQVAPLGDRSGVQIIASGSEEALDYTHVISSLSPFHLNLVGDASKPMVPPIPTVTVMTVNLYYRTPNLHPPGFGYVIPAATPFENNPERALGVVFDSSYSPQPTQQIVGPEVFVTEKMKEALGQGTVIASPDYVWYAMPDPLPAQDNVKQDGSKLTVMLGGHWWDGWTAYPSEAEGLTLAKSVVQRHLGITMEPEVWQVNMQADCIPQYVVGHERKLQTAHNNLWREYKGRLRVAGSWMSGVGVNDCLRSAWDVVRGLKKGKDGTGLEHVGNEEYVRVKPVAVTPVEVRPHHIDTR